MTDFEHEDGVIPGSEEFRTWLVEVMKLLGVSAHRLAIESEAPANSVKKFVGRVQNSCNLDTARALEIGSRKLAAKAGKTLPPLRGVEEASDEAGEADA